MFHVELSYEEREILSQILQHALATLEIEIQHTHHHEFKELLRHRREVLKLLLAKMPSPMAAAA